MRATDELFRDADTLGNLGFNLARMARAIRSERSDEYTSTVVKMTAANFRNALEAALATVSDVEGECLLVCHQREKGKSLYDRSVLPPPRPAGSLPAVVSPCAAE